MTEPIHEYHCDECQHIFTDSEMRAEDDDVHWGHPCFGAFKGNKRHPGTFRCESYRRHMVVLHITDYERLLSDL